jgi:hypothetical protein
MLNEKTAVRAETQTAVFYGRELASAEQEILICARALSVSKTGNT